MCQNEDENTETAAELEASEFSDLLAVRPAIAHIAIEMEKRLQKHDKERGVAGWHECDLQYLGEFLERKVQELRHSINLHVPYPTSQGIVWKKASDVANLAMMLASKVTSR